MGGESLKNNLKGKDGEADILTTINEELSALCSYLEKHNVSGPEVSDLLQPLVDAVDGDKNIRSLAPPSTGNAFTKRMIEFCNTQLSRVHVTLICFIVFTLITYAALQTAFMNKVMSVMVRQLLVLLLPYWDWPRIYYSDCMINNPFYVSQSLSVTDCNICESMETLDVLTEVPVSTATDEYLRNDRPFLVTDAMTHWPVMNTDDFWFDNITELYRSEELNTVYPCELTSNLRLRPDDLQTFLKRIHLPAVERWYGHWENCDKRAAKALRSIYQRPYFMPHMVDFSDTNWVLMSSDYKAKVYKELRFQSEVLWVGVLRGWWHVRVVPREPCNQHCPELTATLLEGQMLVVTNMLWRLEYIPGEDTDNLAIAVGGFWN